MSTTEQTSPRDLESGRVALWRLEQFSSLGFDDDQAFVLAESGADLHFVRSLIAAKCPLQLALRIAL
jgi:hypothetical protein